MQLYFKLVILLLCKLKVLHNDIIDIKFHVNHIIWQLLFCENICFFVKHMKPVCQFFWGRKRVECEHVKQLLPLNKINLSLSVWIQLRVKNNATLDDVFAPPIRTQPTSSANDFCALGSRLFIATLSSKIVAVVPSNLTTSADILNNEHITAFYCLT